MTAAEILAAAGLAESHWGRRIIAAEWAGSFTRQDADRAMDWTTCACGGLSDEIPRHPDGEPMDLRLATLGRDFLEAVAADEIVSAARLLVVIERRAAELLAEVAP